MNTGVSQQQFDKRRVRPEEYSLHVGREAVFRTVWTRDGDRRVSAVPLVEDLSIKTDDDAALFDACWLRAKTPPATVNSRGTIAIADIFSSCGIMTLGAMEACRALGFFGSPRLAVDSNSRAISVYESNFRVASILCEPIEQVIDRTPGSSTSDRERTFTSAVGAIDLMLGGPPCQGHSDLNNHTRRCDPKNALLTVMVRAIELLEPETVVIENVRGIRNDRNRVVDRSIDLLLRMGYDVQTGLLRAENLGVAQKRHRFILLASRKSLPTFIDKPEPAYGVSPRSFDWAAGDLLAVDQESTLDTPSSPSAENIRRMKYLFRRNLYDLPDSERPACHRLNSHSYKSVYGRIHWDAPTQTITTGFGSMGQGRFVHPKQQRTITPHEAARLQFIPDFFKFGRATRGLLAEMIGNAVPAKLTYLTVLEALR